MTTANPTAETLSQLRLAQQDSAADLLGAMEALLNASKLPPSEKELLREQHTRLNQLKRNRLAGMVSTDFELRESLDIKNEFAEWLSNTINHYGKLAEEAAVTWPELRDKLLAIRQYNGVLPAMDMLRSMVVDQHCLDALSSLERDYDDYVWRVNNALDTEMDWAGDYRSLQRRMDSLIADLDPAGLRPGWESSYRERTEQFRLHSEGEVFALISKVAVVQVPEQIVGEAEKQRYKRLIYLYQDAFTVGNYAEAYDYLLKARYELEVESAQLYEYLLLSYFKKTGADAIVRQIMDGRKPGEPDHLRYLMLYAGRCGYFQARQLDRDQAPDLPHRRGNDIRTPTGEYNVEQITRGLLLRLCEALSALPYDYLLDGPLSVTHPLYPKLTNCLRTVARVNRFIQGDVLFSERVMIELAGGHRNQWIGLSGEQELMDVYPGFPARKLLRHARRLYAFSGEDATEADHRIAEDLAIQLAEKYQRLVLRSQIDQENRSELARRTAAAMVTFRVAGLLFPADRLFYDIPIKELLEGEGGLNWYAFLSNGQLIQREDLITKADFDVFSQLRFLVTEKYGEDQWSAVYAELVKRQYEALAEETNDLYNRINSTAYRIKDATYTNVERAVRFLENCETLYHVYDDVHHLENALQEILGNGHFHWFTIGRSGLVAELLPNNLAFDARLYLDRILRIRQNVGLKECERIIGKNYFVLYVEQAYRRLQEQKARYGKLKPEGVTELAELMQAAASLYVKVQADARYRDFVMDEFIEERLMRYFAIDLETATLINHRDAVAVGLDPLYILDTFREISFHDDRLDPVFLVHETVYNRKEDLDEYYHNEFGKLRRHNQLDEDRLRMIELIDKYHKFYQIVRDRSLLEIPYREYVLNRGRIRWGWSLIPSLGFQKPVLLLQHWRNANIAEFSFRQQRYIIKQAYRHAPVVDRLRPLKRIE